MKEKKQYNIPMQFEGASVLNTMAAWIKDDLQILTLGNDFLLKDSQYSYIWKNQVASFYHLSPGSLANKLVVSAYNLVIYVAGKAAVIYHLM